MANVKVAKDNKSFYLIVMINALDTITMDWALSKTYSVVVSDGEVSIKKQGPNEIRNGFGLYRVPIGEKFECTAATTKDSVLLIPFLLSDTASMTELIPNATTRAALLAHSKYLVPLTTDTADYKYTAAFPFASGDTTLTLENLDALIQTGLSI